MSSLPTPAMTLTQPSSWHIAEIVHQDDLLKNQLARLDTLLPCKPGEEYCQRCDHVDHCKQQVDRFFEDMLEFMQTHFRHEEKVMHLVESCLDQNHVFDDHKEAHANLMQRLVELVSAERAPAEERKALQQLIGFWLNEHFSAEDQQLLEVLRTL